MSEEVYDYLYLLLEVFEEEALGFHSLVGLERVFLDEGATKH